MLPFGIVYPSTFKRDLLVFRAEAEWKIRTTSSAIEAWGIPVVGTGRNRWTWIRFWARKSRKRRTGGTDLLDDGVYVGQIIEICELWTSIATDNLVYLLLCTSLDFRMGHQTKNERLQKQRGGIRTSLQKYSANIANQNTNISIPTLPVVGQGTHPSISSVRLYSCWWSITYSMKQSFRCSSFIRSRHRSARPKKIFLWRRRIYRDVRFHVAHLSGT